MAIGWSVPAISQFIQDEYDIIAVCLMVLSFWTGITSLIYLFICIKVGPRMIPANNSDKKDDFQYFTSDRFKVQQFGKMVKLKIWFDHQSKVIRPHRGYHCHRCNQWVLEFDHHWVWIGSCIGRQNYAYIFMSVTFLNIFKFLVGITCLYQLLLMPTALNKTHFINYAGSLALIILGIIPFVMTMFLWWFHTFLIITKQTTYEYFTVGRNENGLKTAAHGTKPKFKVSIAPFVQGKLMTEMVQLFHYL